jgi:signal transduction histidine kinase
MSTNQPPRKPASSEAGPGLHPAVRALVLSGITAGSAGLAIDAVDARFVAAWLLASILALVPDFVAMAGLRPVCFGRFRDCTAPLVAAAHGVVSGAAGWLFLAQLTPPARIALTLLACASVTLAQVYRGASGRAFAVHSIACLGQFALAWWWIGGANPWIPGAALTIFGGVTAMVARVYRRSTRRAHALRIEHDQLLERLRRCAAIELEADRLVSAACHDLRQPVAAISLISALLQQKATQAELAPALASLESGVSAINRQLLRIASIAEQLRGTTGPSGTGVHR